MHLAHTPHASASKSIKLALVVVFHVLLGFALVKTMNIRLITLPAGTAPVTVIPTVDPPPITPEHVDLAIPKMPAPTIVVPVVDVPVTPPPVATTVTTTTTVSDPLPPARDTGPIAPPGTSTGAAGADKVRMAAMMDGCAQPVYPASAARNGDTGTVTLALLIGVDGHVTSSRIARSSGFHDLDKAALTALSRCTFKPAMHGDVAEAGWAQIAFVWTLE